MSESENNDILQPFLIGLFVGAIVAVVSAPCTGSEARSGLQNQYSSGSNELSRQLNTLKTDSQHQMITLLDNFRTKLNHIIQKFDKITNQGADILLEDEIL